MAEGTCSIPECTSPVWCKAMCSMHFQRARRHGTPLYQRPTTADRYWAKVDQSAGPDGCWPWTGATDRAGYGIIGYGAGTTRAHRWAYEQAFGPLGDLHVCHRCDNPPCQNPSHWYAGTPLDNARDRESRGRGRPGYVPGESNGNAVLSAAAVLEIRSLYAAGGTSSARLALQFGVSKSTIKDVISRKTWKHI